MIKKIVLGSLVLILATAITVTGLWFQNNITHGFPVGSSKTIKGTVTENIVDGEETAKIKTEDGSLHEPIISEQLELVYDYHIEQTDSSGTIGSSLPENVPASWKPVEEMTLALHAIGQLGLIEQLEISPSVVGSEEYAVMTEGYRREIQSDIDDTNKEGGLGFVVGEGSRIKCEIESLPWGKISIKKVFLNYTYPSD